MNRLEDFKNGKTKILLVDDHPIVRDQLKQLIDHQADLTVCGEADDAAQALSAIARLRPGLAIVDLTLKSGHGLELIKDIKARYPDVLVLVLSMHDESLYAERALHAGAKGYVMKQEATQQVLRAIRQILSGKIHVSDRMAGQLLEKVTGEFSNGHGSSVEDLSDRELEVYELIGRGLGPAEIAERMHLDVKTIESYRARIRKKLNLETAAELRQHAIAWMAAPSCR